MNKGIVTRSTGSWYYVLGEDGNTFEARLRGKHKVKDLKVTNPIAVGDYVTYDFEKDGKVIIDDILERKNYVIRKSVKKSSQAHIIASNIDQSALIVTLKLPRTSLGFIDRYLVSCESFRIPSIIIFNKQDLMNAQDKEFQEYLRSVYESLNYQCFFTSVSENEGIEAVREMLEEKVTLFSGHSGVGKSSLLNLLAPDISQRVAAISGFADKGKHTTTFAEMFNLNGCSKIIDTPGIKELGLVDMEPDEISHYFPEMRDFLGKCKYYNCTHISEPGCQVLGAVEKGSIAEFRYKNYISMFLNEDSRN